MNEETNLPEGLKLAVKLIAQIGDDESDRAISAVHAACDLAQRVAELESIVNAPRGTDLSGLSNFRSDADRHERQRRQNEELLHPAALLLRYFAALPVVPASARAVSVRPRLPIHMGL